MRKNFVWGTNTNLDSASGWLVGLLVGMDGMVLCVSIVPMYCSIDSTSNIRCFQESF